MDLRSVHDVTLQDGLFHMAKIMVMLMETFYTGHTILLQSVISNVKV